MQDKTIQKLKVVIVDDEQDSIRILELLLAKHCPQVEVVDRFDSSATASQLIPALQPDVLLLDIEMPEMNGFQLLESLMPFTFQVIFVTAYQEFALKAFRFNAFDFLVKPVDGLELQEVIFRVQRSHFPEKNQLEQLRAQLKSGVISKIAVPGQNGITFINLNEISYVAADGNYVSLHLIDSRTLLVSRTMKELQEVLEDLHFLRIHRQYIINLNRVKLFNRNEGILVLDDGAKLPVSRSMKDELISKYGWF